MKLILQITLSVFLGTLAAQFTIDSWRTHRENITKAAAEQLRIQQEKVRQEQGERIRNLILQNRQGNTPTPSKPPIGFISDDAK
jgi:hypothetical protein